MTEEHIRAVKELNLRMQTACIQASIDALRFGTGFVKVYQDEKFTMQYEHIPFQEIMEHGDKLQTTTTSG